MFELIPKLSAAFTKFMRGLTVEGIVLTAILGAVALVMRHRRRCFPPDALSLRAAAASPRFHRAFG